MLLVVAIQYDLEMHQLDVNTTFKNNFLDEESIKRVNDSTQFTNNMQSFEDFIWIKTIFKALVSTLDNYLIVQGFQRLESDGNILIK
jgi:hypothetical protein